MSAEMFWSCPPRLVSCVTGRDRELSSVWKATSMPTLITPSTTRSPPMSRMSPLLIPASSGGTTVSVAVATPSRCLAVTALARNPDQRWKAFGSAPVALTVSMSCRVLKVVDVRLPMSARSAATASVRALETRRSTRMFSIAMATPSRPRVRSYLIRITA